MHATATHRATCSGCNAVPRAAPIILYVQRAPIDRASPPDAAASAQRAATRAANSGGPPPPPRTHTRFPPLLVAPMCAKPYPARPGLQTAVGAACIGYHAAWDTVCTGHRGAWDFAAISIAWARPRQGHAPETPHAHARAAHVACGARTRRAPLRRPKPRCAELCPHGAGPFRATALALHAAQTTSDVAGCCTLRVACCASPAACCTLRVCCALHAACADDAVVAGFRGRIGRRPSHSVRALPTGACATHT
jgi:hypothetical protein